MNPPFSGTDQALLRLRLPNIVLAGPPGAGKSAVGRRLAERLGREFVDTDTVVEQMAGKPIERIFAEGGEPFFRRLESEACLTVAEPAGRVIACGGGALLDERSRAQLEAGGWMVGLSAEPEVLLGRLRHDGHRPLLGGTDPAERLRSLLAERRDLYASIPEQVDTSALGVDQVADRIATLPQAERTLRMTAHEPTPGYPVVLGEGLLAGLGDRLGELGVPPPALVVSDTHVGPEHGQAVRAALQVPMVSVAAGERHKSHASLLQLYNAFADAGLDRDSVLIAVGGGVLTDLAGFAAATYLRGIRWIAMPTSLLAMVDASLGGKVGVNLQAGKNLVGAFHAPMLVCADLDSLATLPRPEVRAGLSEIVKAALVGDAELFSRLENGPLWITRDWIQRAMRVKLSIVDQDPQDRGRRALLNLGHTFAHALEAASGYSLPHGQAVAVGLVGAARLAHTLQRCEADLPERVERVLARLELPRRYSGLEMVRILAALKQDKKNRSGRIRFVMPVRPGQAEYGVEAPEALVRQILESLRTSA
jgi:3-dehydroquinate synthase